MEFRARLAARVAEIAPFHVMEVQTAARVLEAAGRTVIHMEIGEPDFPTPAPVVAEAQRAIGHGDIYYTSALGIPALRSAIAAHYAGHYGVEVDPERVIARLDSVALRGVDVRATLFTPMAPTDGKYAGVALKGIELRVRDRRVYDPTKLAVALLAAMRAVHPEFQFRAQSFDRLAAGPELRTAIEAGRQAREIWNSWTSDLERFRETRTKYLIY